MWHCVLCSFAFYAKDLSKLCSTVQSVCFKYRNLCNNIENAVQNKQVTLKFGQSMGPLELILGSNNYSETMTIAACVDSIIVCSCTDFPGDFIDRQFRTKVVGISSLVCLTLEGEDVATDLGF